MNGFHIPGTTRETVDIGSTSISYQKGGQGPSLLFIHGWPLNGNTWRNVVPHLPDYTSYVIDLPGSGESPDPKTRPLSVPSHSETVIELIDALDLKDVVLVAQDSGGMVARFVAAERSDRIKALTLIGTEVPHVHSKLIKLLKVAARLPGAEHTFRLCMGTGLIARSPLILGGTVHDTKFMDGEFRTNLLDPILASKTALKSALKMLRNFSFEVIDALAEVHPALTMPTLLVFGEDDTFFPIDKARDMVSQFGGPTTFVSVPDAKLFVHEEYPELLATEIRDFLADLPATATH